MRMNYLHKKRVNAIVLLLMILYLFVMYSLIKVVVTTQVFKCNFKTMLHLQTVTHYIQGWDNCIQ